MRIVEACLVAALMLGIALPAYAEPLKCQRSILKESTKLARTRMKVLQKCEDQKLKGTLPGATDCASEPKIAKAETKLRARLDKSCGGPDRTCGTGDDEPLPGIGWPAACPDFQELGCTNTIVGCDDIGECLVCVDRAAVEQAAALHYPDIPSQESDVLKCQRTIGGEMRRLFDARANALRKCWDTRYKGGHANDCPSPGDGKAEAKIAKATSKARNKVCRSCGGADRACGGGDDLVPAAVGFPATCPDVGECAGVVGALDELVDCMECVTAFDGDCIDALAVQSIASYPATCTERSTTGNKTLQLDGLQGPVDLDLGPSGFVHDLAGPWLARLTAHVVDCSGDGDPTFGECALAGPIANEGGPAYENQRCADQPWVKCATDDQCVAAGAAGPCRFFLGPPQSSTLPPLSLTEITSCLLSEITGPLTGTVNIETGAMEIDIPVSMRAHGRSWTPRIVVVPPIPPPLVVEQPCPTCVAGSCVNGPRDGMPCVAQGESAVYGGDEVSLDCPPDGGFEFLQQDIRFPLATQTTTLTIGGASPTCTSAGFGASKCPCDTCNNLSGSPCASDADCPDNPPGTAGICGGLRCLTGTNAGAPCTTPGSDPVCNESVCTTIGEPTRPNRCNSGSCTPTSGTEGECTEGPSDHRCLPTESLRPCDVDTDCPFPGDSCGFVPTNCFPGGSVTAVGLVDLPVNGTSNPTLASLFCVPPQASPFTNFVEGLPGLARITLPVTATVK